MTPPPGFTNSDPFNAFRDDSTNAMFRGFNPIMPQQNRPWPQSGFDLPFGGLMQPPPMAFNSFGIGAGLLPGLGQGLPPPPPFGQSPFGQNALGLNPFAPNMFGPPHQQQQQQLSPPQDKPLQLNQLPGFNIFGVRETCLFVSFWVDFLSFQGSQAFFDQQQQPSSTDSNRGPFSTRKSPGLDYDG